MLSKSRGLQRNGGVLGYRKDAVASLSTPCPVFKKRGRCPAHNKELELRRQIAKEKEAELRKKAMAMYKLQLDLLEDGDEEMRALAAHTLGRATVDGSGGRGSSEQEVISKFIEELRREPEYLQWNIEAVLEERLVMQGVRRCPFSHRVEVQAAVKRSRCELATEAHSMECREGKAQAHASTLNASPPSASTAAASSLAFKVRERCTLAWDAERVRVFDKFTTLQKCVVCLVWQRSIEINKGVLCDVRKEMIKKAENEFYRVRRSSNKRPAGDQDDEEELENYLESPEFTAAVDAATKTRVRHIVSRPALGVFDLSALPSIIVYVSNHPKEHIITRQTQRFFMGEAKVSSVLVQRHLTEKELDVSAPARAEELVEALEWVLYVFSKERMLGRVHASLVDASGPDNVVNQNVAEPTDAKAEHTNVLFRTGQVVVRSLTMRACNLSNAEGLVTSLYKHGMQRSLLALDLSCNRLNSLRFLFILRSHFAERLLRLSLKDNLITRKPEYQEQVRLSLPRLTSLDGEAIRRAPMALPKPLPTSYSIFSASRNDTDVKTHGGVTRKELGTVMDYISRLIYIFESGHIPHTDLEKEAFTRDAAAGRGVQNSNVKDLALPPEEEVDEDNFAYRYLHPSAVFSFTMAPGLTLLDPETMRLNREVEADASYQGMRLNPLDMKDMRVFDVAMKNSSRNLLFGRAALQRHVRGNTNCYLAYQLTMYPERMSVNHHLDGAVVSIVKVPGALPSSSRHQQQLKPDQGPVFGSGIAGHRPNFYLVTLHGIMTWRLPSMHGGECVVAAYDRVLTLVDKVLPVQNRAWERRRSPKVVLFNDQVHLRPAEVGDLACYVPQTPARVARLVVEFGLEACRDGVRFVQAVMERATSDAAESAALDALVFGPPRAQARVDHDGGEGPMGEQGEEEGGEEDCTEKTRVANAAMTAVLAHYTNTADAIATHAETSGRKMRVRRRESVEGDSHSAGAPSVAFHIFSLLDRPVSITEEQEQEEEEEEILGASDDTIQHKWGSKLHVVTLAMLDAVVAVANEHHTCDLFIGKRE